MFTTCNEATHINSHDVRYVIGVDEAGRGCMAGPVSVTAVCFRLTRGEDTGVVARDSKKMSVDARRIAYESVCQALGGTSKAFLRSTITNKSLTLCRTCDATAARTHHVLGLCTILVPAAEIDRVNILNATLEAMSRACYRLVKKLTSASVGVSLHSRNCRVLIDGNRLPWAFMNSNKRSEIKSRKPNGFVGNTYKELEGLPCEPVVGGDDKFLSIAAASVVAKVSRDHYATTIMHQLYPNYGFDSHKGYCTENHKISLNKLGPCEFHRNSYGPVQDAL